MASAAGIIATVGGITLLNEALSAPYQQGATDVIGHINWRLIPATAVGALLFAGIERVNGTMGRGLAWLALVTALFVQTGSSPSPLQRLADALGYGTPAPSQQNRIKTF